MLTDLESLVYLFLVLSNDKARLGMIYNILDLLRNRILVSRNGNTAKGLCGDHGAVKSRPVIANNDKSIVSGKTKMRQPGGESKRFLTDLPQRPGLPDTVGLLTHRRPFSVMIQTLQQKLGESLPLRFRRIDHTLS